MDSRPDPRSIEADTPVAQAHERIEPAEFGYRFVRRFANIAQSFIDAEAVRVVEPRISIEDGAATFDEVRVRSLT